MAPATAPQALAKLDPDSTGPRLIFPPNGAAVQVDALGPKSSGLVLAAHGEALTWYVNGRELASREVSGKVVWRPDAAGFYRVTVVDGEGRKAEAKVRIRAG